MTLTANFYTVAVKYTVRSFVQQQRGRRPDTARRLWRLYVANWSHKLLKFTELLLSRVECFHQQMI